jgi:hypothetical protein
LIVDDGSFFDTAEEQQTCEDDEKSFHVAFLESGEQHL